MFKDYKCTNCGHTLVSVYTLQELAEVGRRWTLCPRCRRKLQEVTKSTEEEPNEKRTRTNGDI